MNREFANVLLIVKTWNKIGMVWMADVREANDASAFLSYLICLHYTKLYWQPKLLQRYDNALKIDT